MNDDQESVSPATKADLIELREWILEREITAARWTLGLLGLYFFGTLASVWFLVNQQIAHLGQQITQLSQQIAQLHH